MRTELTPEPSRNATIILMVAILTVIAIGGGYTIGYITRGAVEKEERRQHCNGYTVLDSSRVILCTGDTVPYDCKSRIRIPKK